jgi:hypothetical protein
VENTAQGSCHFESFRNSHKDLPDPVVGEEDMVRHLHGRAQHCQVATHLATSALPQDSYAKRSEQGNRMDGLE